MVVSLEYLICNRFEIVVYIEFLGILGYWFFFYVYWLLFRYILSKRLG